MTGPPIAFVLHRPARGGNIGASARALMTMGFSDLRISEALGYDPNEARAWAHGSTEVLDRAATFGTLPEAIQDADLVVGTSARRRGDRREYLTPMELRDHLRKLHEREAVKQVALLFGPEEHGLTNEELDLCQLVSEIPMRRSYPSLNLAQAVMVYSYELSPLSFTASPPRNRVSSDESVRRLHEKVTEILPRLGFDPGRAVTRRIIERVGRAGHPDVHLMHSVINALERRLLDVEKRSYGAPE